MAFEYELFPTDWANNRKKKRYCEKNNSNAIAVAIPIADLTLTPVAVVSRCRQLYKTIDSFFRS